MEVNGKTFYHILSTAKFSHLWKPGEILIFSGEEINELIKIRLREIQAFIRDKKDGTTLSKNWRLFRKVQKYFLNKDKYDFFSLYSRADNYAFELAVQLERTNLLLNRYINLSNEFMFEIVREIHFKEMPSRLRCFWLCDKKSIKKWWGEFKLRENKRVFEVAAFGNAYKVDRSWIICDTLTPVQVISNAKNYWQGLQNPEPTLRLPEYLFVGKIEILKEIKIEE